MNPLLPKVWNPEPIRATGTFVPVFSRPLTEARTTHLMREAYGWTRRAVSWPADSKAPLQEPYACATWAALNAFRAFCKHHKRDWFANLDAMGIHGDAQALDGMEGGDADKATTIEAAMEAICESANSGMREPWVYWAPVPLDLVGCWQDALSPVVVDLKWPREWASYNFWYKTLLYSHANAEAWRHAVALVGHEPEKRAGIFRKKVRAFQVHDSEKGELIWIEAGAMARNWVGGAGFLLASQHEKLKRMEVLEPKPLPLA